MNIVEVIERKKQGLELTEEEIKYFVAGAVNGNVRDYQASALLMAILLNGMTDKETFYLTEWMANSGEREDLSELGGYTADKHSSGGVGDSTTFITAPAAAAMGLTVAKMSGRALGHTGGTVDKLMSIPGFNAELNPALFKSIVKKIGLAVTGQSANLCPADKKLYALRDVTATVDSIPLIASSIMSKKLAGGAKTIVLDVKYGAGAFMTDAGKAIELAELMVRIGKLAGRNITAAVTDMNEPLDAYIGNRLELRGAVNVLKGGKNRLYEVSVKLAALMAETALGISSEEAEKRAAAAISSGAAYEKLMEMVAAQGGDLTYMEELDRDDLPFCEVLSEHSGFVTAIDAKALGNTLIALGGGRLRLEDAIDYSVGMKILKRIGDKVSAGDALAFVYYRKEEHRALAGRIRDAFSISLGKPKENPLILKIIR